MRNRNIAEILEDDRNGKELSQTERRIVTAYIQGKYDAVRELKINNNSNTNELLEKISAEIEWLKLHRAQFLTYDNKICIDSQAVLDIIYKYKVRNKYEPEINPNASEKEK